MRRNCLTFFICLIFIELSLLTKVFAQNSGKSDVKVDSVMTNYLNYLKSPFSNSYDSTDLDSEFEDFEKRILFCDFFENISGLYLKRELKGEYGICDSCVFCWSTHGVNKICEIFTVSDYEKWENWYKHNRSKLIWVDDNKVFRYEKRRGYLEVNYDSIYPSSLRFKDNPNQIPISEKPGIIRKLENEAQKFWIEPIPLNPDSQSGKLKK